MSGEMLYKFHLIARGKTFASNLEILLDNAVKTVKPFYDFFPKLLEKV